MPVQLDDIVIWANGGTVGKAPNRINYKQSSLYTDLIASKITTVSKGKISEKAGKLIVGITISDEIPTLTSNKIIDKEAAKIAKAAIKNNKITITAQKQAGLVYLWVYDLGDEKLIGYAPITVKLAPSKVAFYDSAASSKAYKKEIVVLNQTISLYFRPTVNKDGTLTEDATYTVTVDEKMKNFASITQDTENDFLYTVTADSLDLAKPGKALNIKFTAICNQNGKKATFTLSVRNPVISIMPAFATNAQTQFTKKGETSEILFHADTYGAGFATTDKPTVYVMTSADLTLDNKNKLIGTKSNDIKATLNKTKTGLILTAKKEAVAVTNDAHIYVTFKNGNVVTLFYVGYVDKQTGNIVLNNK